METLNERKLKNLLFESFTTEKFLQWFYDNEEILENNHSKFYHFVLKDWDILILPKTNELKNAIKSHLVGEKLYSFWEIEFLLVQILYSQESAHYASRLYSEYYEDKNFPFLNSIADLIVLYCYDKESIGLPPLTNNVRKFVNESFLYLKIVSECHRLVQYLKDYPNNKGNRIWKLDESLEFRKERFKNLFLWYTTELKKY